MKKNKIILTALMALVLGGCGAKTDSDSERPVETSSTGTAFTESASQSDAPVSTDKGSDYQTTSDIMDSSTESTSESELDEEWGDEIVALMVEHLGGQTLPYFNMGKALEGKWDANKSNVIIYGSNSLNNKKLLEVKEQYEEKGWLATDVTADSTTMTVTNKEKHLSAVLSEDKYGYILFTITYDEPFDASLAAGEWNDDVKETFNNYLDGHILPYVYLGTDNNLYLAWTASSKTLVIRGKKWDDSVTDAAKAAFDGYELTSTTVDTNGRTHCVFEKVFTDGCKVSVAVHPTNSEDKPICNYIVTYSEVFDASTVTDWKQDVKTDLATLDNHEIPYIYLGTKTPTSKVTTDTVTLTGGPYNVDVFATAKSQFEKAGWETYSGGCTYGDAVYALHTYDDGCTICATVKPSGNTDSASTTNNLVFTRWNKLDVPSDVTAWDENISALMVADLGGHVIPFSYIGSAVKGSYVAASRTLTLTGDKYNPTMLSNFKDVLVADGWTAEYSTNNYGRIMTATKEYDDGTVTLTFSSALSFSSKFTVSAVYREKFDVPSDGSWGAENLANMKAALGGFSVPYFYMASATPTFVCSEENGTVTITGGDWNDRIQDFFIEALEGDTELTWKSFDTGDVTGTVVYKAEDEKGNLIIATLSNTTAKKAQLALRYKAAYDSTMMTAWDETTTTTMTSALNGHQLPFVYLGSKDVKAETKSGILTIGARSYATFSDKILSEAKKVFDADGFTTVTDINTYGNCLQGTKTYDDGYTIRFNLEKAGTADYAAPRLIVYLDAPLTDTRADDYSWNLSTANQTKLDEILDGETAPDIFLGTGVATTLTTTTLSANNYATLKTTYSAKTKVFTNGYIIKAKADLESQGFACKLIIVNSSYGSLLYAEKALSNNKVMKVSMAPTAATTVTTLISVMPSFVATEMTDWSSTLKEKMKLNFDGYVFPFFDLGTDTPTMTFSNTHGTYKMILGSDVYDEAIFESVEKALKDDTSFGGAWTYSYQYVLGTSYTETPTILKTLVASSYNSTTGQTMCITLETKQTTDKMSKYVTLTALRY